MWMKKRKKLSEYKVLRKRAIELWRLSKDQKYISDSLGVAQSTVSNWISAYREKGESSIDYSKVGGSVRRISKLQQERLIELLEEGAVSCGYEGEIWTRPRVRDLIERVFGIKYGLTTVGDLLRDLGYTVQKPSKSSYKQDAEKVRKWKEEELPALKKKP